MLLRLLLLQLLAASTRADNLGATLNIYYEATDGRCEGPYTQTYVLEDDGNAGCIENLRPQISFSGYCEGDNVNFHGFFDSGTCDGTPDWVSYDDSNRLSGYGLANSECSRETFAAGTDPDFGVSSYKIQGEAGGWLPCPVVPGDCWTVPPYPYAFKMFCGNANPSPPPPPPFVNVGMTLVLNVAGTTCAEENNQYHWIAPADTADDHEGEANMGCVELLPTHSVSGFCDASNPENSAVYHYFSSNACAGTPEFASYGSDWRGFEAFDGAAQCTTDSITGALDEAMTQTDTFMVKGESGGAIS